MGGLPPPASSHGLRWFVGIASLIVFALVVITGVLTWTLSSKPESKERDVATPTIFRVNRLGTNDASPSLAAALNKIRGRSRHPAHIIVEEDLTESDVQVIELHNVTIEAAPGKSITWKPASSAAKTSKLLTVNKAEGFQLKGFTLDGENRIDFLVNLYHHCPATILANLTLKGFNRYGIWVMNCEGDESPDRHILLTGLTFEIPRAEQTAVYLNIENHTKDKIPKNKFITIRDDCKFIGPGVKIKTPDLNTLERDEFPPGAQPVTGN